jgi:hypothetical protein
MVLCRENRDRLPPTTIIGPARPLDKKREPVQNITQAATVKQAVAETLTYDAGMALGKSFPKAQYSP